MGGGVTYALEASANEVDTNIEWKPEGSIIAQGEDGVPWELYENGYLLFKPEHGKDTLSNNKGDTSWKETYGNQIKAIGFSDKVYAPEDCSLMFSKYPFYSTKELLSNLQYIDASKIDTSKVTNMHEMFASTSSLITLDVSNWDTSQVTNMSYMFYEARGLTNLNVSNWNTSNVKYMNSMFWKASSLTKLDVSKWNVSNVTEMSNLFRGASSLTSLDVSNWNTSKVTNISYIFAYMSSLTKLDLSNLDTSNMIDMSFMLSKSTKLKELKIGTSLHKTINGILFHIADTHDYGNLYTNRWVKKDGSAGPYTTNEWWNAYIANPEMLSGTWVREKTPTKYTLNFDTSTVEQINPIEVEKDIQTILPIPTVDNKGYKFLGWSKTQDGKVITDTTNIANPSETIILYAQWEKVDNIAIEIVPIKTITVYKADNTLDKENRIEEEGQVGEKEIITTYKVTPITGELTEPTTIENIITPMKPKVVKVGTKPTEVEKRTELSITEKQTDTLVKGKERIIQGSPRIEKEITEYTVNENTGDITESKRIEIVDTGTPTVKEVGTREPNTIVRDVNGKDLTDDELPNYTNLEPNPINTTDNGDLVYIVHKIITKYKGNDTLELNKQVVEKDGKTDGVKLIQVGTKPTVTTIERDNKQIKQTTTYIVNEDTGELTPNTIEEIIGDVKPTTSNGDEKSPIYEIPEYTKPISTNIPIDENGELILPPIHNKEEYTQPISTNTPVDKDENLSLPPIVNIPAYKDDIVNETQKGTKEKLEPKDSNKQTPSEIYHQSDKKQDVVKDTGNTEVDNNNVVQKQVLPKTNAFYNTHYVLGLLLSAIGLKQNKKD